MKGLFNKNVLACLLIIWVQGLKAQSDTTCASGAVIKIDVASPIIDYRTTGRYLFSLSAEKFISPEASIQLTTFLGSYQYITTYEGIYYQNHLAEFIPELRHYFAYRQQHKGIFVGGLLFYQHDATAEYNCFQFSTMPVNNSAIFNNFNQIGLGFVAGGQLNLSREFILELQIGVAAIYVSSYGNSNPGVTNPIPEITNGISAAEFANINLGYKF